MVLILVLQVILPVLRLSVVFHDHPPFLTAGRVRHLRRQSAVSNLMQSLFCQINDRYLTYIVSESTGSIHDQRFLNRLDQLRQQIQRWFASRHQLVS